MKKTTILLSLLFISLLPVKGDEGMWLLPLLEKMNSGKMTELGFEITPEEIFSLNNTSLKDMDIIKLTKNIKIGNKSKAYVP